MKNLKQNTLVCAFVCHKVRQRISLLQDRLKCKPIIHPMYIVCIDILYILLEVYTLSSHFCVLRMLSNCHGRTRERVNSDAEASLDMSKPIDVKKQISLYGRLSKGNCYQTSASAATAAFLSVRVLG